MSGVNVVIVAVGVVLTPVIVIFGAVTIKILWGFFPLPVAIAASGYAIWRLGMEYFFLIAVGIAIGIVLTWAWQRTKVFLAGDRILEKMMFIGD